MINLSLPTLIEIAFRTAVVYLVVVLGVRVFGRRGLGQMTPLDLVLVLTISNAVQNAMTGPDTSLTGGIVAAFTLLLLNWLLASLRGTIPWIDRWFVGEPVMVVYHGKVLYNRLRRTGYTVGDLEEAAREHGVENLRDIRVAVVEVDGTISVVPEAGGGVELRHLPRRYRWRRHR